MVDLPFGPYEPDRGRFNTVVVQDVNNLVPTADGYGPLAAIIPTPAIYAFLTDPETGARLTSGGKQLIIALDWSGIVGFIRLPSDCTGLFAARKKNGDEVLFAGTETALYKFNRTSFTWEDVSSTTYASACRWSFEKFGDEVRCQNGADYEQVFDIETDDTFSSDTGAPICKYLKVIGPFLFRFNIVAWAAEPSFVSPAAFMCSAHENPGDNTLQNYNWCDAQFIPNGDEIMGVLIVAGGAHVWLRGGLVALSITMDDFTFRLGDVDTTRGVSAPYSLCSFGQGRYLAYCDDGFWLYDGGFSPIGQGRINKTFLEKVDQDTFEDVLAMNDPENAVIWIAYTNTLGQRRMFGFQYNLGQFTASDIEVKASFVCRTFVYTESDPPILKANQPRFTIIDQNDQLGYLVGAPMAASLLTNEYQVTEDRSFTSMAQLDGDALDTTLTVITRDIKGGPSRTRTPATPSDRSGNYHFKASGRTTQFELNIAEGQDWTTISGLKGAMKRAGRS